MRSLDHVEDRVSVWQLISKARRGRYPLTDRMLRMLLWRFGFLGAPLTLQEIANEFGVSRESIRRYECLVLKKLRKAAGFDHPRRSYEVLPVERETGRQRPVEEPPPTAPRPPRPPEEMFLPAQASGDMMLTCDGCGKTKLRSSLYHYGGRMPLSLQLRLWRLAEAAGWQIQFGRDLCPRCAGNGWTGSHGPGSGPLPGADQPAEGGHQCGDAVCNTLNTFDDNSVPSRSQHAVGIF